MKKFILTILLGGATTFMAFANSQTRTTFYTNGPLTFKVFVNGSIVNPRPDQTVSLDWLAPGRHRVKVVATGRRGNTHVYTGNIRLLAQHHSQFLVSGNRGMGLSVNMAQQTPIRRRGGYGYGQGYDNVGGYYNNPTCPAPTVWTLNAREVRQIGFAMDNQAFDEDKLRVARRALRNNKAILSADLRILLNRFTFDRHRLQLAKFAYERVADPQNFYLVYNSFTYASSYQELDHFLGYNNQPYYRPGGRTPAAPRNGNAQGPGRGNGGRGGRGQRG